MNQLLFKLEPPPTKSSHLSSGCAQKHHPPTVQIFSVQVAANQKKVDLMEGGHSVRVIIMNCESFKVTLKNSAS